VCLWLKPKGIRDLISRICQTPPNSWTKVKNEYHTTICGEKVSIRERTITPYGDFPDPRYFIFGCVDIIVQVNDRFILCAFVVKLVLHYKKIAKYHYQQECADLFERLKPFAK